MHALQTALQTPQAMQQTAMCPDSWLWIRVEIHFGCIFLIFVFLSIFFSFFIFRRGCQRLCERQTALLAVVTYLSSAAFVSPLVVTKYDQLAPSRCLWAPGWELLRLFDWDKSRTIQPESGWAEGGDRKRCDSGGIVGLKFQLRTAVVSRGSEGFPGWRCPNGSVLIWYEFIDGPLAC